VQAVRNAQETHIVNLKPAPKINGNVFAERLIKIKINDKNILYKNIIK
jgi:hypothetical protein